MKLPPVPKWNPATDDFDASDFVRLAQEYDRTLLPPGIVFPRAGQVWETLRDCDVCVWACMTNPGPRLSKLQLPNGVTVTMSGVASQEFRIPWGTGRLHEGERVRVLKLSDPKPIAVHLEPLRYDTLHDILVPAELRKAVGYTGYCLIVKTARPKFAVYEAGAYLSEEFKLVEDVIS